MGYVKNPAASGGDWTNGGIGRIMTKESLHPDITHWQWSIIKDGLGPVTTSIARSQDKKHMKLWLYFGTGRYFYGDDDRTTQRRLFGIKDPCYLQATNRLDTTCTTSISKIAFHSATDNTIQRTTRMRSRRLALRMRRLSEIAFQ